MILPRTFLLILAAGLVAIWAYGSAAVAIAVAADPIMRPSEVVVGMRCNARTVLKGTTVQNFEVTVVDVVGSGDEANVLVTTDDPLVTPTGIAEGFSGSPIFCPRPDGSEANIGAIAYGTADYGNRLVYVTSIAAILRATGNPGVNTRRTLGRKLASPLMVGGVSGPVASALRRAGGRAGRTIVTSPQAAAAQTSAAASAPLVPGSAVAVGYSAGALPSAAIGTVTYVDGNRIWAFGHPYVGVGRRNLLLQSAWVHAVVGNPLSLAGATPYKLASPGPVIGTVTDDDATGVSGLVGVTPQTVRLTVNGRNLDNGFKQAAVTTLADEGPLGNPTGASIATLIAPVALAQQAYDLLRSSPAQQSARVCVRVRATAIRGPLRYCNRYVGGDPRSPGAAQVSDLTTALRLLDGYRRGPIGLTSIDIDQRISTASGQAYVERLTVSPRRVRPGRSVRLTVTAREAVGGRPIVSRTRWRVPPTAGSGERQLRIVGTEADVVASGSLEDSLTITVGQEDDDELPTTLSPARLRARFAALGRDDRLRIRFGDQTTRWPNALPVRLSGSAAVSLTILPRRR